MFEYMRIANNENSKNFLEAFEQLNVRLNFLHEKCGRPRDHFLDVKKMLLMLVKQKIGRESFLQREFKDTVTIIKDDDKKIALWQYRYLFVFFNEVKELIEQFNQLESLQGDKENDEFVKLFVRIEQRARDQIYLHCEDVLKIPEPQLHTSFWYFFSGNTQDPTPSYTVFDNVIKTAKNYSAPVSKLDNCQKG